MSIVSASMQHFDVAVVGAGIAGAGLAAELAPHGSVLLLEGEGQAGYHSTGRSAAFWSETYGGPAVQPLTTASGPVLRAGGFLRPLGSLHLGREVDRPLADSLLAAFAGSGVVLEPVDPAAIVPGLRPDWTIGILEPSCAYIDVAALHADCLSRAARAGARLVTGAALRGARREGGRWRVDSAAGSFTADILANAAGAWADSIAALAGARALGIQPYRRTVAQLRTAPAAPADLPHVIDIAGTFYFKPEPGGRIWLSPHDETACHAHDVAAEELDVAEAVDRFEHAVDWRVEAVERRWAGLRSFAPDRLPVYGFDPELPGFFWCAGQGGFGIQTAPAASALCAALLLERDPPAALDPAPYQPGRFASTGR